MENVLQGFLDDIMNKIGGERGGIRRKVED